MPNTMTIAVRDDLAKLAYAMCRGLPPVDRRALIEGIFARRHDLTPDMAYALYVRGKDLVRREKGKAA